MKQVTLAMGADECTVTLGIVEAGHEKRPHSHPEEQIALCIQGECDYWVDGKPCHLTPGGFVTVPGGVEHYVDVHDTDIPCFQMDIFGTPRPEFKEKYMEFLESLKKIMPRCTGCPRGTPCDKSNRRKKTRFDQQSQSCLFPL